MDEYKKYICSNCINKECKKGIVIIEDLYTKVVKCVDYKKGGKKDES